MGDGEPDPGEDAVGNRIAWGMALGAPFGIALSLMLDNWGLLGVGMALGVAFGAAASDWGGGSQDQEPEQDD